MKLNHLFITWTILLSLLTITTIASPPILTNFQQFYGTVSNLPNGTGYFLNAKLGNLTFTAPIAANGQYGYAIIFKVFGSGTTINFTVTAEGRSAVPAGTTTFDSGAVTLLNPRYNDSTPLDTTPGTPSDTPSSSSSSSSSSGGGISTGGTLKPNQCRQNWICGFWNDCLNDQQTRSCYRDDQCAALTLSGEVNETLPMPKPVEFRDCETPAAPAPQQICSPNSQRCLGQQLQECLYDGKSWNTLEFCQEGCDPIRLSCRTLAPPQVEKPFSFPVIPVWIYLAAGALILIAIVGGMILIVHKNSKYAPAKEYIKTCRDKYISDSQIKAKLLGEGWDEKAVDKLLK